MKLTFGRKFFAGLIAILVLVYFFSIVVIRAPAALNSMAMILYGVFVVTICFAYIGGNIWKSWIKSKYFRVELHQVPPGE